MTLGFLHVGEFKGGDLLLLYAALHTFCGAYALTAFPTSRQLFYPSRLLYLLFNLRRLIIKSHFIYVQNYLVNTYY